MSVAMTPPTPSRRRDRSGAPPPRPLSYHMENSTPLPIARRKELFSPLSRVDPFDHVLPTLASVTSDRNPRPQGYTNATNSNAWEDYHNLQEHPRALGLYVPPEAVQPLRSQTDQDFPPRNGTVRRDLSDIEHEGGTGRAGVLENSEPDSFADMIRRREAFQRALGNRGGLEMNQLLPLQQSLSDQYTAHRTSIDMDYTSDVGHAVNSMRQVRTPGAFGSEEMERDRLAWILREIINRQQATGLNTGLQPAYDSGGPIRESPRERSYRRAMALGGPRARKRQRRIRRIRRLDRNNSRRLERNYIGRS